MNKISTVQELINKLDLCSGNACYFDILNQLAIPEQEFEKYYLWDDGHYTRVQLVKRESYELVLVCWDRNQCGDIHDYDAAAAWIHPVISNYAKKSFFKTKKVI